MRWCLLYFITCLTLQAQPGAPALVRDSIRNGERSWRESLVYSCIKRDIDRQFDSSGRLKHAGDDLYEEIPLGFGAMFEMPLEHNREPVARSVKLKAEKELGKLRAETPSQKERRFQKEMSDRSYMKEVADAFHFRITGEQQLPTGPAWVLEGTPNPDYQPRSRYGRMFAAMRGTLWIDEKDVQWVKADAVAMETISFGYFIARLARGSHIVVEQMRLPDGAWVAKSITAKASARTFLLFSHNFEEEITYSRYQRNAASPQSDGRSETRSEPAP